MESVGGRTKGRLCQSGVGELELGEGPQQTGDPLGREAVQGRLRPGPSCQEGFPWGKLREAGG